jgi:hypothetical protein
MFMILISLLLISFGYGYICVVVCLQEYTTGFHYVWKNANKNLGYIHFGLLLYVLWMFLPFYRFSRFAKRYYTNTIFHYLMTYRMLMCW